ncbi:hypothetical protein CEXT_175621 [Caerostris extrusa]|uniref:Uncharacterized protein n=1 Tax=Caerostris extrusa TaxID=172846 RepID=A0AAV4R9P0_CAEEX|nr:hypothetical protein CEXT_175621 [Caerostris extrusa]
MELVIDCNRAVIAIFESQLRRQKSRDVHPSSHMSTWNVLWPSNPVHLWMLMDLLLTSSPYANRAEIGLFTNWSAHFNNTVR